MIEMNYGDIALDSSLHAHLLAIVDKHAIPEKAARIVLNCRQMDYYRTKRGLHPVEVQFKRESVSSTWVVVFFASFSYPDEKATSIEPELYFHLTNRWCYQPDTGSADLSHPELQELLSVWMSALARHLYLNAFDDIQLSMLGTFN